MDGKDWHPADIHCGFEKAWHNSVSAFPRGGISVINTGKRKRTGATLAERRTTDCQRVE